MAVSYVWGPETGWDADTSAGGASGYSQREKIPNSSLVANTDKVSIGFRSAINSTFEIDLAYVGHYVAGGNLWKMDGSQVKLTFGGSDSVEISADSVTWSDPVAFSLDNTKDLIISIDIGDDGAKNGLRYVTTKTGFTRYYKAATNAAEQDDPAGFSTTSNRLFFVEGIQDRNIPVLAETSLTLTPSVVDSGIYEGVATVALSLTPVAAAKKLYDALAENSLTLTPTVTNKQLYLVAADVSLTVTPTTSEVAELQVGCTVNLTLTQGTFYLWTESCDTAYGTARPRSKDNHIFMYTPFTAPNLGMQLSRPEYNNIDEDNYQISTQHAISGTKHVFAHTPTYKTLHLSFKHQSKRKVQEFRNFIEQCAGIDIRLIDWELRQWRGIIISPTLPLITTGKGPYSEENEFSFIFEGEEL